MNRHKIILTVLFLTFVCVATSHAGMTTHDLFIKLTDTGYLTQANLQQFLGSLDFDDVYTSLSADEVLNAVIRYDLVNHYTDPDLVHSYLIQQGIEVPDLRADGMLTILSIQKILKGTSLEAKNTLRNAFFTDKTIFLDTLTRRHVLQLLEGANKTSSQDEPKKFLAYAGWTPINPALNLDNLTSACTLDIGNESYPQGAVNKTAREISKGFPASIRLHDNIAYNMYEGNDTIHVFDEVDGDGNPSEFLTIWMDQWAEKTRSRLDTYFRQYRDLGGKLDLFIVDFESGGMYYPLMQVPHYGHNVSRFPIPTGQSIWQVIMKDSRWPKVAQKLGFSDLQGAENWPQNGLGSSPADLEKELIWNRVMEERRAEYISYAIYEPLKKYFPNAIFSNYSNSHFNQTIPSTWDVSWAHLWDSIGEVPKGWYQSASFYGCTPGETQRLGCAPADHAWDDPSCVVPVSPFNRLVYLIAKLRGMITTTDTPVLPWIEDPGSRMDSTTYAELLFHLALGDTADFLYWNPSGNDAIHRQVSDILHELDTLVGFKNRKTLSRIGVTHHDNYLLTGMSAAGRRVWRFTPRVDQDINPNYTAQNALSSEQPATFTLIDGSTLTIPNSRVSHPSVGEISNLGYWVIQDEPVNLLSSTATNIYTKLFLGDIDADGTITAHDAALAAQMTVNLRAADTESADVTGDGEVTGYDAALIAQRAVGLISRFPIES